MSLFTPLESLKIMSIKQVLQTKADEFRSLCNPYDIKNELFFSGGAIASMIQGELPNDYDLYCTDNVTMQSLQKYLQEVCKNDIAEVDENYRDVLGVNGKMITENAITFKNKVQLITKNAGEPKDVRATFDYVHCMPYYNFKDDKLYISHEQYDLCLRKKLKVNNKDAVGLTRTSKFMNRGYSWL